LAVAYQRFTRADEIGGIADLGADLVRLRRSFAEVLTHRP